MTDPLKLVLKGDSSDLVAAANNAQRSLAGLEKHTSTLTTKLAQMGHLAVTSFLGGNLVAAVRAAGGAMFEASVSAQRLTTTLQFAGGNAARDMAFLREVADRLGLGFQDAAKAYAGFAAAARGTSLAGAQAREVFTSIAEASAVMGLSADDTRGVLLALQQMISKGTVQAEELRGQLGERLPGAFQIAARAMGVTTQELGKMLEQGQVLAVDLLPRLASAMRDEIGAAADVAAQRLEAATARMGNAWDRFLQRLGDSGISSFFAGSANAIKGDLNALSDAMKIAEARGGGFVAQLNNLAGMAIGRFLGLQYLSADFADFNAQLTAARGNLAKLQAQVDKFGGRHPNIYVQSAYADAQARVAGLEAIKGAVTGDYGAGAGRGDGSIQLAAIAREKELADAAKRLEDGRIAFMAAYRDNDQKLAAALKDYRDKFGGKVSAEQQRVDEAAILQRFAVKPPNAPNGKTLERALGIDHAERRIEELYERWWRKNEEALDRIEADEKEAEQARLERARELNDSIVELNIKGAEEILARNKAAAEQASVALSDSIAEGILHGFRDGQSLAEVFLRELKAQFAKTVLSPIIRPTVEAGNQAIGDLMQLILQGIRGGGPTGTTGGWSFGGTTYNNPSAYVGGLASGGPAFAGQTYLVGEQGPELLRMGAMSGHVTPNRAIGGIGKVEIHNHSGGEVRQERARGAGGEDVLRVFVAAAADEVDRRIASGGSTGRLIGRHFGASRTSGAPRRG